MSDLEPVYPTSDELHIAATLAAAQIRNEGAVSNARARVIFNEVLREIVQSRTVGWR